MVGVVTLIGSATNCGVAGLVLDCAIACSADEVMRTKHPNSKLTYFIFISLSTTGLDECFTLLGEGNGRAASIVFERARSQETNVYGRKHKHISRLVIGKMPRACPVESSPSPLHCWPK